MAPQFLKALTAAAALYASLATALPVQKRTVIWETVTDVVVETVTRTSTVRGVPGPDSTIGPPYGSPTMPAVPTVAVPTQEKPMDHNKAPEHTTPTPPAPTTTAAPPPPPTTSAPPPPPPTTSAPPPPPPTTSAPPPPPPTTTPPVVIPTPPPMPKPPVISVPPVTPPSTGGSGYSGPCAPGAACSGEITFYDGGLGACGMNIDTQSDDVIALPYELMGPLSNNNPFCGKTVSITYNGITSTAIVKDKCMGCTGQNIDMTRHLFYKFGVEADGRIPDVKWHFI
ncbi:Allergen-like Asp f 7 [Arthroderma uncinatum]|uniref:Allergen-like Asp f 7 n=1 Tax=Arthroderma uncinatum TaxID=74035 RepID=UPI00144AF5AA|nr:Allergen-like Asp f 7 [Arthroderma uncinatum]KAF3491985.1 Allergen-like Asp f 7 [Arthroderma uncinatum]